MNPYGSPKVIVTDKLESYGAAMKELGDAEMQEAGRWLNVLFADTGCTAEKRPFWAGTAVLRNQDEGRLGVYPKLLRRPLPARKTATSRLWPSVTLAT